MHIRRKIGFAEALVGPGGGFDQLWSGLCSAEINLVGALVGKIGLVGPGRP